MRPVYLGPVSIYIYSQKDDTQRSGELVRTDSLTWWPSFIYLYTPYIACMFL